jgi:hypothetical protein
MVRLIRASNEPRRWYSFVLSLGLHHVAEHELFHKDFCGQDLVTGSEKHIKNDSDIMVENT